MATRRQFLQTAGYRLILLGVGWLAAKDARATSSGIGRRLPQAGTNHVSGQRRSRGVESEHGPSAPPGPPEPPLPPARPPPAVTGLRYRNQQPYLFQTVRSYSAPARVSGGSPLYFEQGSSHFVTPSYYFVDKVAGWAWDRPGGDYIDANLVRNPAAPREWFSVFANAVSGNTAQANYTVDVTKALQFIETTDRDRCEPGAQSSCAQRVVLRFCQCCLGEHGSGQLHG